MAKVREFSLSGFSFAIASAATFGLSGIFASALIESGWTAGAAAAVRMVAAALVLAIPTVIALRGQWASVRRAIKPILLFGAFAIAGCQLFYFLAIQFIAPSLAIVIEFMGPVLLIFWFWMSSRKRPSALTLIGAGVAVLGLLAVSGIVLGGALHPLGILFALGAAVGVAVYFATGASTAHGIPPLPFVGLGLMVASAILIVLSLTGLLPFGISSAPAVIAGTKVSPWLVVSGLVLVSTVFAYILGVAASRRLGATVASFTGYSEPMFGIFWTIVLLAIMPTAVQWLGAALIITGVVVVKVGELRQTRVRV